MQLVTHYFFMKKLYFILCLFSTFFGVAQSKFEIKGKVVDATNYPLESATVFVNKVADSSLVEYAITDAKGEFVMQLRKSDEKLDLKIALVGSKDYVKRLNTFQGPLDLGTVVLDDDANLLGELIILTEAPPVRVKADTLEFNAASFKVRPDANVESLLKQLPGVDIDTEGTITVNGKTVDQILVNGKSFFGKDGKIALQSLPADLIKKVQVSDTKTRKEELTKQQAASENSSINLTIDEDKNTGYFGKFSGGYGTDDRYEASAIFNYFKGDRKLSFLGSSNNVNASGFSMDDVFDNMSGGRSNMGKGGAGGGSSSGITRNSMLGVNYSEPWFDGFENAGSYFFTNANNENRNRTEQINLLADGNFTTLSERESESETNTHKFDYEIEYKINPTTSIVVNPSLESNSKNAMDVSTQKSIDEDGALLNENASNSRTGTDSFNFSNSINFNKAFGTKGKLLSVDFTNKNQKSDSETRLNSETYFYNDTDPDDIRNQYQKDRTNTDLYSLSAEYLQPVADSLKLKFSLEYNSAQNVTDNKTFDFDAASASFNSINQEQSSYMSSLVHTVSPGAGFIIEKSKTRITFNAGLNISDYSAFSDYINVKTNLDRDYVLPSVAANYRYKPSRGKNFNVRYRYNTSLPSARQILPFEDLSNPLNTIVGNPDLDVSRNHAIGASYNNYNATTKNGWSVNASMNYYDKTIISIYSYDENRKRTTTYTNVDDTYNISLGGNWSKSVKRDAHNFRYGIGLNNNYRFNKGFVNTDFYDARLLTIAPRVYFSYDYGELLTIRPSYSFNYNITNYENYRVNSVSNNAHRFNVETTSYWPNNLVWGNDFGYTYNSNIADGFKKDFYLWNTSVAYYFFEKTLLAKVKVYDLLNQNLGNTRTVSETSIVDQQNTVLKRYVMFSLTYKIDRFGGKQQSKMKGAPKGEGGQRPDGGQRGGGQRPPGN